MILNGLVVLLTFFHPISLSSDPPGGAVHLVLGDGGNYEGPAIYEGRPPGWRPQPAWSAFREASYGPGWLVGVEHVDSKMVVILFCFDKP